MTSEVKKIFCVLGKAGVGKGTICKLVCENFQGVIHISVGELLREYVNNIDTEDVTRSMVRKMMENGQIVPSEITISLVKSKMDSIGYNNIIYLIDGFPRNIQQKNIFEREVGKILRCFNFVANENEVKQRLRNRAFSSGRCDDNPETILKRETVFNEQCLPVLDSFKLNRELIDINLGGNIEDSYQEFINAICKIIPQYTQYFYNFTGKYGGAVKITSKLIKVSSYLRTIFIETLKTSPATRIIDVHITDNIPRVSFKWLKILANKGYITHTFGIPQRYWLSFLKYFQVSEKYIVRKVVCNMATKIDLTINIAFSNNWLLSNCSYDCTILIPGSMYNVYPIFLPKNVRKLDIISYHTLSHREYISRIVVFQQVNSVIKNITLFGKWMRLYASSEYNGLFVHCINDIKPRLGREDFFSWILGIVISSDFKPMSEIFNVQYKMIYELILGRAFRVSKRIDTPDIRDIVKKERLIYLEETLENMEKMLEYCHT